MSEEWLEYLRENEPDLYEQAVASRKHQTQWRDRHIRTLEAQLEAVRGLPEKLRRPSAHTYASENADVYAAYDRGRKSAADALGRAAGTAEARAWRDGVDFRLAADDERGNEVKGDEQFEGFLESRIALAPGEEKDCSGLERPASVEAFADRVVLWCGADQITLYTGDLKEGESRRLRFYPKVGE